MEPLRIAGRRLLKCLLCDAICHSESELTGHIHRHLSYRKYNCLSCRELFYTMEEREEHCIEAGHAHTYGTKVLPYSERYADMLLKDALCGVCHGTDAATEHGTEASVAWSRQERFPWRRLPRELAVQILQHLGRRDLDNFRLLNREIYELVRSIEPLMRRRVIDYLIIIGQNFPSGDICELDFSWDRLPVYTLMYAGGFKSKELSDSYEIHRFLKRLVKFADIKRLDIIEGYMLNPILASLRAAGCRVHELRINTITLDTGHSYELATFLRHEPPSLIRLTNILEWSDDLFPPEVLRLMATTQEFSISNRMPSLIPLDDDTLTQLTAPTFSIDGPNMITRAGLQRFIEDLARGIRKVERGEIRTNFKLQEIPLPALSRIRTRIKRGGYKILITPKRCESATNTVYTFV